MSWVREMLEAIRVDEPGAKVYVEWHARQGLATLSMLQVPEDRRGQGSARRIVETLVEAADLNGVRLAVTPTDEFGADLAPAAPVLRGLRVRAEHRRAQGLGLQGGLHPAGGRQAMTGA